jgi:hypothetical protein
VLSIAPGGQTQSRLCARIIDVDLRAVDEVREIGVEEGEGGKKR